MKSFLRSGPVQAVLAFLIWSYMALIGRSVRWQIEGLEKVEPLWDAPGGLLFSSWHSRIFLLPVIWTQKLRHRPNNKRQPAILISLSRDGEFVARASEKLGLQVIRGSAGNKKKADKDKGGAAAIREVSDLLGREDGVVCMTVDGPRGPRQRAAMGAALLAQRKRATIVTYALATAPAKRLNSWDRFVVPLPFTRGAIVIGDIIKAERGEKTESIRARMEAALNSATQRAEELVGGEFEPPAPQDAPVTPAADQVMAK